MLPALRKRREEKRREEKRREEKRREEKFLRAGFIFGSLYRFDRLKKIFTDVEGRIISGWAVFQHNMADEQK
ncbi:hypothetical protein [Neisseria gonorrhoeae]|uniref:hypothetical protein n=1 Tax=Neisseria gonorrhoeae TaxID=485 RepID=UPI0021E387E8|nr:hypothetical protein [Neisseria gonorrhoeae]UXX19464.1 hypothetical protein NDQ69_11905 [Neisseria gonorrhoeae]